jgi:hypothetical protein
MNSFREILAENIEHIIFDHPIYTKGTEKYKDVKEKNMITFHVLKDIIELGYKFEKKYNIVYQNESLFHGCDFTETKKQNTDMMIRICDDNKDKQFMIIDHGRFDHYSLSHVNNCQVWPRKYFAPKFGLTHEGQRKASVIQKERKHWFCSVLGRNDYFRSRMFDWIIDNQYEKTNKVSYLAFSQRHNRDITNHDQNHESEQIESKHRNLIPFNNFEGANIPIDNNGRLKKAAPVYDCLFNILVETYATNHSAFHSEKSLNTILYGHVPVIAGGEGSMKKFQDMGIIIPDYIQWTIWDDIPLDQQNYNKIDILQRQLVELFSKQDLKEISDDWYPYAVRNFKKLMNIDIESAKEEKEICRWILTATHNLSNPEFQKLYL